MLDKKNYDFYVLAGIYSKGFKGLSFGKYGVSCTLLQSAVFKRILKQISQGTEMLQELLEETKQHGWEKITYVLFSPDAKKLNNIYQFLLLLQPSKLQLMADFHCQYESYELNNQKIEEHHIVTMGTYDHSILHFKFKYLKDKQRNLFFLAKVEAARANMILELFMNTSYPESFSKLLGIYYEACMEKKTYVKFLLLTMFIESLVIDDETTGITYKLARMCAVLAGDNPADAGEIFERVKQCYRVRSKLVHSAKNEIHTGNFLLFMHSLVSEILITIILNKMETRDLFKKTTAMAFGNRSDIWKNLKIRNIYNFFANEMNLILDLKSKK